jgi:hypothetical protein
MQTLQRRDSKSTLRGGVQIIREGRQDLTHLFKACSCPVHGPAAVVILLYFLDGEPILERDIQNTLVDNM